MEAQRSRPGDEARYCANVSDRDQEIIVRVRRSYEALSRGDFDAAIEIAHPEIELVPPGGQGSYRGADAVRAWMEPDAFEDQRIEPREFRVQGNRVLVLQHTTARGAGSGIELDLDNWAVWTLDDDGLVTRIESFLLHEERKALEAAGLRE
jgi:ketosteroid isomerase-like protein